MGMPWFTESITLAWWLGITVGFLTPKACSNASSVISLAFWWRLITHCTLLRWVVQRSEKIAHAFGVADVG